MTKNWLIDIPFAHRGRHGPDTGFIENSLSAFLAAQTIGHGFELDVLLSKDDIAMVFHDEELHRLTGHSGYLADYTAEELENITLSGSKDTIPTLKTILSAIDQSYPVLIEIKGDQGHYDQIAKSVYQEIKQHDGPVAIMSFYPEIIVWFHTNAAHIKRGLVATSINDGKMPKDVFSIKEQRRYIDDLDVDFIAYDIKALPNEVTEYCRETHKPVLTWTVRSTELYKKAKHFTDNVIYENIFK